MRGLVRVLFTPALLGGCVASWEYRSEAQRFLTQHGIRLDFASCVLLGVIALIWVTERLVPARENDLGDLGRDLLYLFLVTQFSAALITLGSLPVKSALGEHGFSLGQPHLWPATAPFVARVLLAFFTAEFFSYWLHRAAHRVPLLWQFHATHHALTQLGGLKALRTHPVENLLFSLVRTVPLLLLGAGEDEVLTAITFGGVLGLLAHANLDLSSRGVGLVVNLPGYHAVHHSAVRSESDANYGCHTILFDRVFGTFIEAPREPLRIGLEPPIPGGPPVGRSMFEELIAPFFRRVR